MSPEPDQSGRQDPAPAAEVLAVSLSPTHSFSKQTTSCIHLLAGLGVQGDAHCGATVRHQYLRRRNPSAPNLTQVHLLAAELLQDLARFELHPGDLGENLTTLGLDLIHLPLGTRLHLGTSAIVELTGLRTPCVQMNRLRPGLMAAAFTTDGSGRRTPRAGVMAIVVEGGAVAARSPIRVQLPAIPHLPLRPV